MTIDTNTLFSEIVKRMATESVFEQEAYFDLVDEVIEEKLEGGSLTDDDDTTEMAEVLKSRWPDAEAALETGHDKGVIDEE